MITVTMSEYFHCKCVIPTIRKLCKGNQLRTMMIEHVITFCMLKSNGMNRSMGLLQPVDLSQRDRDLVTVSQHILLDGKKQNEDALKHLSLCVFLTN